MKLLLDMNLSPTWVRFLEENGFEAVHGSTIGEPTATDAVIMAWARITHDLDFSALLASTELVGPSVMLVRTELVDADDGAFVQRGAMVSPLGVSILVEFRIADTFVAQWPGPVFPTGQVRECMVT
jgi:predicted nuclease of predicted toxin-antitoxin system